MKTLLQRLLSERYTLSESRKDNVLHEYIDDNADDLLALLDSLIAIHTKEDEKHVA
ncbi:hypothetical protein [Paenibacillus harenae]|uniref:hypothetical protein n=1 Tax=Paenibacillus harenae TaxID=306543 RepID=UPI00279085D4|nr:hypothetical protein [Paenibacillus harenae]MDQ0062335.1 hypothetical protein [Paenibacillus harenae]